MIEPDKLKIKLDEISDKIPELLNTTNSITEILSTLGALHIIYLEWLEVLAEDTRNPYFKENFSLVREKIFELISIMIEFDEAQEIKPT